MNTGLARLASSRSDRPRSLPSTHPSPRFAMCSATVAATTAATTVAIPCEREGSTNRAATPAETAASALVDVQVSQRAYGGLSVGRRLAALTQIAARGP